MSTTNRQDTKRTRKGVCAEFFLEDTQAIRITAKSLARALAFGDFSKARYELETLAQYHVDLENLMDAVVGPEPVEGDDPMPNEALVMLAGAAGPIDDEIVGSPEHLSDALDRAAKPDDEEDQD